MKALQIKAYRDRRGPIFILSIPGITHANRHQIERSIECVVSKVVGLCIESRDKPRLKVDLKIKYDQQSYKYSFCMFDDQKLSTLKNELLTNDILKNAGIKQMNVKLTL